MILQVIFTLFMSSGIFSLDDNEPGKYELLSKRLALLENEVKTLKQTNGVLHQQLQSLGDCHGEIKRLERAVTTTKEECRVSCHEHLHKNESVVRKERASPGSESCCGSDVVSFYSYMSHNLINPSGHHTIIFNVAKTNIGHGYSPYTGVFMAPKAGVYVFTWQIRLSNAAHSTELIVNQAIYGATYLSAKNGDDSGVTGVVVAQLSQGDVAYVRTHDSYNSGHIIGNGEGYSSFAGWKLN